MAAVEIDSYDRCALRCRKQDNPNDTDMIPID